MSRPRRVLLIDDNIDAAGIRLGDVGGIRDVTVNEAVILFSFVFRKIFADAGVRQLIEIDDVRIAAVPSKKEANEIRSDETGAASDEVTHAAAVYIQFPAMKLLILGATGPTGRQLVRQALEAGHSVAALVRDRAKVSEAIEVIQGDATDSGVVAASVRGCDAVLSALGTSKSLKGGIMTRAVVVLLPAMEQAGVKRLILVSAFGVGDSHECVFRAMG